MGIQGLLPQLKSIMVPIHVKDLRGCCVAIDTYSWLHKGALSCSKELCKGEPTTRHVDYCMHRVNLLRHHGVKPILVFDGGFLPMKSEQETKRSRVRKQNLERAIEHELNGNSATAYDCYQKAVDISPLVAYELIQVLKQEKVDFVVAPYEADAQMTFLALSKHVDAVITEDSDLIAFGCPRIVFKMDKFGQGVQFQYSMLHQNKELNFTGFTKQMVLEMCILSGCDYLQSLPGMGLKKAHALIKKFRSYEKVIKHLRYNTVSVPPLYEESFKKALWTFHHQRVYDPAIQDIVHLMDIPNDLGLDLGFLGPSIPQDLAKGIARGEVDPITKLPFQGGTVRTGLVLDRTYPLEDFRPERERKKLDLPAQKNILTNYFCSVSIGAKRKFKAPRIIPKNVDSTEESTPGSEGHVSKEHTSFPKNDSQGPLLDSGNYTDISPPEAFMEEPSATDDSQSLKSPFGNLRSSEHTALMELSKHAVYKPCLTLYKERECKFVSNGIESKMRTTRKVIVRSSYFQHKLSKNDLENKNEEHFSEEDAANGGLCEHTTPESASFGNYLKSALKKRKSVPVERTKNETVKVKCLQTNVSPPSKSTHVPNIDNKSSEMGIDEGNFGCNISHLCHYSDIAEKSMEKFVSVMSSFRCTSSGSRASGLRAPLKDVRNTFGNRSTIIPMDLSKFSYAPHNQKTASASLRN